MAIEFSQRLVAWQLIYGRHHLPWSQSTDFSKTDFAYRVWLSEVMLQQTQVNTVIPYFDNFQTRFPTIIDLAQADINEVLALWAGLGYYSRARHLHRAAQIIAVQHAGIMPNNFSDLIALPGIGKSTAGAILSLAYQQRAAILDGNVKRVLARHAGVLGWSGSSLVSQQLWQVANDYLIKPTTYVIPEHHRRYTQGLMDLGATVCHKRKPDCVVCPVAQGCFALEKGLQSIIPEARPKQILPIQHRSALVLHDTNGVWLLRRESNGLWGGLLSFLEAANDTDLHQQALTLLKSVQKMPPIKPWQLPHLKHTFTHYQLNWTIWGIDLNLEQSVHLKLPEPWQYVVWHEVNSKGVPAAVLKVLANQINL